MNTNNEVIKTVTAAEAAELLGVGKKVVYKLLKNGELNGIQNCDKGTWHIPVVNISNMIKNKLRL